MTRTRSWLVRIGSVIAIAILVMSMLLAFGAFAGCASTQSFAVGKLQATEDPTGNTMPSVLARWDGDLFVGWAQTHAIASVEPKGGGIPFYYVQLDPGYALVYQRTAKFRWRGKLPAVLPLQAMALFTTDEISSWGLTFADPGVIVAPETPPGGTPTPTP